MLGDKQQVGLCEHLTGFFELMGQLAGVGRDLVKAREHDEADQARVYVSSGGGIAGMSDELVIVI